MGLKIVAESEIQDVIHRSFLKLLLGIGLKVINLRLFMTGCKDLYQVVSTEPKPPRQTNKYICH